MTKVENFEVPIRILEKEREETIEKLKSSGGNKEYLIQKLSIEKAISYLKFFEKIEVNTKGRIVRFPIPSNSGHFSDYRIMDDRESDNSDDWVELKFEGEKIRPEPFDYLVINSERR